MLMQQSTRLQRRCYWLLESEDDIVLVHYLNIDKAKGKTEDTWAAPDADLSRRPGFTVTSGGIHNIQVHKILSDSMQAFLPCESCPDNESSMVLSQELSCCLLAASLCIPLDARTN